MAIKIIVDSASYITEVEAQEIGITMIPMIISFGGEDFLDGEDISPKQFYEKLVVSKEFPKTAQITPFINTLEYLKKGGRISGAAAMIGTALALKPTVAIVDGEVKNIGKSIGVKRAQTFMLDIVKSKGGIRFDMPHCVIWSGTDDAVQFVNQTPMLCKCGEMPIRILGSTIGTHVGPGAIGIAFFHD